ncbi:hypothetical protein CFP56_023296 [Quercus suber]|uniref:Uncharacterized protein n=1 Tax=Quercus suber TaxID=58331 RepID=A0AAW0KCW8_QUESU
MFNFWRTDLFISSDQNTNYMIPSAKFFSNRCPRPIKATSYFQPIEETQPDHGCSLITPLSCAASKDHILSLYSRPPKYRSRSPTYKELYLLPQIFSLWPLIKIRLTLKFKVQSVSSSEPPRQQTNHKKKKQIIVASTSDLAGNTLLIVNIFFSSLILPA